MSFVCVTCAQKFQTAPDDAVEITRQRGTVTYRFIDGSIHFLRRDNGKSLHSRWHQTKKKPECIYCFPSEPEPSVEHVEVVQVLESLPEPQPEPVAVAPEPRPNTSMAAAFNRLFK